MANQILAQVYGHKEVSVLDGGLPRWKARDFPTTHGAPPPVPPVQYKAGYDPEMVRTFEQMVENFANKREQVRVVM